MSVRCISSRNWKVFLSTWWSFVSGFYQNFVPLVCWCVCCKLLNWYDSLLLSLLWTLRISFHLSASHRRLISRGYRLRSGSPTFQYHQREVNSLNVKHFPGKRHTFRWLMKMKICSRSQQAGVTGKINANACPPVLYYSIHIIQTCI